MNGQALFGEGTLRGQDDLAAQEADQPPKGKVTLTSEEYDLETESMQTVSVTVSAARMALVNGVKAYALEHYNDGGWDVVVETYDDYQVWLGNSESRTVNGAVTNSLLATLVSIWADQQADAVNSAF